MFYGLTPNKTRNMKDLQSAMNEAINNGNPLVQ